ncbi:MAG: hypothetical protein QXT38_04350 [Candidatus Aenigmatarchaeota archaeon]
MMKAQIQEVSNMKLEFTGNWFIDAGILGFVNLMEEVFGWSLGELEKLLEKNQEEVYYKWFIFGYLFYHFKIRTYYKDIQEIRKKIFEEGEIDWQIKKLAEEIRELEEEISKEMDRKEKGKILKKLEKKKEKLINLEEKKKEKVLDIERKKKELEKEKERFRDVILKRLSKTNIEDILENGNKYQDLNEIFSDFKLNLPPIARNFYIFNSSKVRNNWFLAFKYLYYLCKGDYKNLAKFKERGLTYEIYPDSTINPFLFSEDEFSNIGYTKPLSVNEISNALKLQIPIYISLLSFEHAFENYYERGTTRNIFFYTDILPFCYSINRRMKIKKEIAMKQDKSQTILRLTISSIIDELVEKKADFSLENMYLIEYENIENQKLINVKYIGVPKLQASIILNDVIRENLNKFIEFRIIRGNIQYSWLIEEFIKGKPLHPIILNHIYLVLNEKALLKWSPSFYSLVIEANILKFKKEKEDKSSNIFSDNYFDNYKSLINQIKKDIKSTSFIASLFAKISDEENKRKRIARELFNALKTKDKNIFLNILLKNMNEKKELCRNNNLINWIFDKIINNDDESFIMYGLILTMGLLRGKK